MPPSVAAMPPSVRRVWRLARRGLSRGEIIDAMGWRSTRSLDRAAAQLRAIGHAIGCLADARRDPRSASRIRRHVAALRARGMTWAAIGAELGVSRQRAHQIGHTVAEALTDAARRGERDMATR